MWGGIMRAGGRLFCYLRKLLEVLDVDLLFIRGCFRGRSLQSDVYERILGK
jgi:hypothetical protein